MWRPLWSLRQLVPSHQQRTRTAARTWPESTLLPQDAVPCNTWQVFEDCRAAAAFGGAWFNGEAKLVDCHFLRCHAGTQGGGGLSPANGASVEMIRGSIMGCSGASGGGVWVYGLGTLRLLDVTIAECRATADDGDGGGIFMSADASVLTMSGGAIRDCEAPDWGGGLWVGAIAQAHLQGVAVQRCKAMAAGGMYLLGIVSLVDVSIEDCSATIQAAAIQLGSGGSLRAERVQRRRARVCLRRRRAPSSPQRFAA